MALYNLVRVYTATTGTGTVTLGAAVTGFLTFAQAGVPDGATVSYGIKDGASASETGTGTYTLSTLTLTRTVTNSTVAPGYNTALTLVSAGGIAEVYITALAADIVTPTSTNTLTNKTLTSPVMTAPALGIATGTSFNGLTVTTTTGTVTMTNAKTLAVTNSLTLSGTDSTTMTFPTTTATLARTDAANTFTGVQTMTSPVLTSPVLTTPAIGAATGSTVTLTGAAPQFVGGANTATLGSVKLFGNTSGDITIRPAAVAGTGVTLTMPAATTTIPGIAVANTWTGVQNYAPVVLTFAATQTWDVSANPFATLAMTANITSFSVSGVVAGAYYTLKVTQDTSVRTIAYTAANFKFIGGSAPTLGAISTITYYHFVGVSSTVLHEVGRAEAVA